MHRSAVVPWFLTLVLAALVLRAPVAAQAPTGAPAARTKTGVGEPLVTHMVRHMAGAPIPPGQGFQSDSLFATELISLHAAQVRHAVALHVHDRHDETVAVFEGRAMMRLGDLELTVEPGSVLHIPRGTPHSVYNPDTTQVVLALTCFTPPFDGQDRRRVPVGSPAGVR